ncbi:MAG: tRNA epoxyqueuosine(34) reductase QueG [Bacteroidales bacterium]|nr:tRNA epoxyqueuosine(34) reductase QueG [Bacteroidales bacterium]
MNSKQSPWNDSAEALKEHVRTLCRQAGAAACGFARVAPVPEDQRALYRQWLRQNRHADMEYMERYTDVRDNPALLLDGARTIISLAFPYTAPGVKRSPLFADYALGDDYHDVLRKRLTPVADALEAIYPGTRICIDTAPLRERYWATRAGIGYIGLNNQLIVPGIGSAVFLAEILWTAALPPDTPLTSTNCSRCGACLRACPGTALNHDGSALDARRCLSYLTIENRGALTTPLRGRIYGCDICRDVCPEAHPTLPVEILPEFTPRPTLLTLRVADITAMTQETFSLTFRRSAIKRAKLAGLLRNAQAASELTDNL